jgi:hypothetical protein
MFIIDPDCNAKPARRLAVWAESVIDTSTTALAA